MHGGRKYDAPYETYTIGDPAKLVTWCLGQLANACIRQFANSSGHQVHVGASVMKVYDAASIRNVALVGHSGSGKTQLASAILTDAGMINRFGKVDDGTTVTDFDEEEIARKHTLSASVAYAEWNKQKINLIDTPGMGNFFADAGAALTVADAAIVVVDAVGGVMVQTEKIWAAAEEIALPRLVVVNRLDRDRASLDRTLVSLREACHRAVIPIQLPIGEEKTFRGVVDLVSKKAFTFQSDSSGKFTEGGVPADMTAAVD